MNNLCDAFRILFITAVISSGVCLQNALAEIVIVDNDNANNASGVFSELPGDSWGTTGIPSFVGQWAADYRWKSTDDPIGEVEWRPTISTGGDYEVAVWYRSTGSGRPNNARYTVDYNGGTQDVVVNQQIDGSQWVVLGTYPFTAGTAGRVTLTSQAQAGKNIVADSVRFRRTGVITPSQCAGMRVSRIPFSPFPQPDFFVDTASCMTTKVSDASPCLIWIVSLYWSDGDIGINFPNPTGQSYPFMNFSSIDRNEAHLDAFDAAGVDVWLQVEPGDANVEDLIDIVLLKYGHHPCVVGFGVDGEWFNPTAVGNGRAITDVEAQTWLARLKSYDPTYRLFLKHYLQSKMPPTLRSDILFVDDSQDFPSLNSMVNEFTSWGNNFSPAEVGFQYGYPNDRPWWDNFADPAGTIASALEAAIPNTTSFFWVDFTIEKIVPIGDPPSILLQPVNSNGYLGEQVSFSVAATGDGDLSHQWQRNGVALSDGACCNGALTPNMTVTVVDGSVAGDYRCVISGACGDIASNEASLSVLATGDYDGDGDIDLIDYDAFTSCMTGPDAGGIGSACAAFDSEPDNDIDLADFGSFQDVFTGSP